MGMLEELGWMVAGGAYLVKDEAKRTLSDADEQLRLKDIREVQDKEFEEKLSEDINDPSKYDEIWERIEIHKRNRGNFTREGQWDIVGKARYPLGDTRTLRLLMQTYGKLQYFEAFTRR